MIYKNLTLDPFQEQAIDYINKGNSVMVSAPTGSGKTLIAEYVVESCLKENKGVIYTAPIKALSNQKYRDFSRDFPNKVGIVTGDVSIDRENPLIIMTTEIFRNLILVEPHSLNNKQWIIFDEIHFLDDIERGTVWEEAIMLLPKHIRILALSATVPNISQISNWISSIHSFGVKTVVESKRSVPLSILFQSNNKIFDSMKSLDRAKILTYKEKKLSFRNKRERFSRDHDSSSIRSNKLTALFDEIEKNTHLPCIYFSFSRKKSEHLADEISGMYNFLDPDERKRILELYEGLLQKFNLESNKTAKYMYSLVGRGIAFHHAGLLPTLKEIIEVLFTSKLLKVIFTTETFALGINMPAKAVIFDDVKKFSGRFYRYIKTRDFYQIAGRAGRRGIDDKGFVYLRISPLAVSNESLKKILYSDPEDIQSQFKSNYATVLNLYRDMKDKIYDIYPLSFHFFSSDDLEKKEAVGLIEQKVKMLKELGYINNTDNLTWKGELASRLYSYELPIGELYENGYFENLTSRELSIILLALVYEPRKNEKKPRLSPLLKKLKKRVDAVIDFINKKEKYYHIYPYTKKAYFHLAEPMIFWLDGIKFANLSRYTDIDEGEIVRYFRMVLQVLRELMTFEGIKKSFKDKVYEAFKRINRDVIDAEKQLRQSIE